MTAVSDGSEDTESCGTEGFVAPGIPSDLRSYVCIHVVRGERPVLLVGLPHGEWAFGCGDYHESGGFRVAGIGHVFDDDPTLREVLDLDDNEEAERSEVGGPWVRSYFEPE